MSRGSAGLIGHPIRLLTVPPEMTDLADKRILVVEDSPVVAEVAEQILERLDCTAVGPAPNMALARELAEHESIDAAIIDIRIRGEKAFSICEILAKRGIPFVLTSGFAHWDLRVKWADRPSLAKPYTLEDVQLALTELLR